MGLEVQPTTESTTQPATQPAAQVKVQLEDVVFRRGQRTIFDGLSLAVPAGKTVAIMGPSGSGKTTLLKLIGGQLRPASGRVTVDGQDVAQLSRAKLFEMRRHLGMLFQEGALFTDLSVFENVAFPLRVHTQLPDIMIRDLALMKLHAVGLRGAAPLQPAELSGGMQRRVALARAVALDPALIMYDEPFTGLDPIALGVIVQLIRTMNDAWSATSIIVSHDIKETAAIADYIYLISGGKLIGEGTPEELGRAPSPRVQQFLEGQPDGPVPFHYPAPDYRQQLMAQDKKHWLGA
ncbi:MAG: ABC transporter ATP-binding protein [Pseudomonadales bacterium]